MRDYRTVPLTDPEAPRLGVVTCCGPAQAALGPLCYAGGALQLVTVSTIYAWLPSYLDRFRHADRQGGSGDRAGADAGLACIVLWGYVADRLGAAVRSAR